MEWGVVGDSGVEAFTRFGERVAPQRKRVEKGSGRGSVDVLPTADVELPGRARGRTRLVDNGSNATVEFSLQGVRDVSGEASDGYLVFRGAADGSDVITSVTNDGVEDFVVFEEAPRQSVVTYDVRLGAAIAGLRLVANTLEFLDVGGAPRLRVAPPYLVDAGGEYHRAELGVLGCAHDTDPSPPWDRPVVAPGATSCGVEVRWSSSGVSYPALLDPQWATTGNMVNVRLGHQATPITSGRVLVTGGYGAAGYSNASEIYQESSGTWAATFSMNSARYNHRMALNNAQTIVWVTGGFNGSSHLSTTEYFPLQGANGWGNGLAMNLARSSHSMTALADNRLLVAGGEFGAATDIHQTAETLNLGGGIFWTFTGSMNYPHSRHTATRLADGKVFIAGGFGGDADHPCCHPGSNETEVFNPSTNAWAITAPLTCFQFGYDGAAALVGTNKVLLVGGYNENCDFYDTYRTAMIYDPATNTWSTAAPMLKRRRWPAATTMTNGKVLVTGGYDYGSGTLEPGSPAEGAIAATEVYDPVSNYWSSTGDLHSSTPCTGSGCGRYAHTASFLANGRVLVTGGWSGFGFAPNSERSGTCQGAGVCGAGWSADGCYCDGACVGWGDCCPDACSVCGRCSP